MKLSILSTVIILVMAALIGRQHQQRIHTAQETHTRLIAEARSLGLRDAEISEGHAAPRTWSRPLRPPAAEREAGARDLAKRLSDFALAMKQAELGTIPMIENQQEKIFLLLDEVLHLDAAQLKTLIAEIRANPALDDEMRRNLVGFSIMMLANDHPVAALALSTESADLFTEVHSGPAISTAISRWAELDPAAALAWLRHQETLHPNGDPSHLRSALIGGTAKRDPAQAFQLIHEFGATNPVEMTDAIAASASDPAGRSAVLSALRAHLAANPGHESSASMTAAVLRTLGREAIGEGFSSASRWMESAALSPKEAQTMVEQLHNHQSGKDTGKWVEWMADRLPPAGVKEKVDGLVRQWTQNDYRAAGEWLVETPPGDAKNAAVKAYAQTVAPYDTQSATQWAITLPPGPDRTEVLRSIHRELVKTEPAAAEAFATRHGITEPTSPPNGGHLPPMR